MYKLVSRVIYRSLALFERSLNINVQIFKLFIWCVGGTSIIRARKVANCEFLSLTTLVSSPNKDWS